MGSYAACAASIDRETPFRLYSAYSFGSSDLPDACAQLEAAASRQTSLRQHRRSNLLVVASLLMFAALMAALFTCGPLQRGHAPAPWANYYRRTSSGTATGTPALQARAPAPAAQTAPPLAAAVQGTIRCASQVQHGRSHATGSSSRCDRDVEYLDGRTQHITIWRSVAAPTAAAGPGPAALLDRPVALAVGGEAGEVLHSRPQAYVATWDSLMAGRHLLRRQQHPHPHPHPHRKLLQLLA